MTMTNFSLNFVDIINCMVELDWLPSLLLCITMMTNFYLDFVDIINCMVELDWLPSLLLLLLLLDGCTVLVPLAHWFLVTMW